MANRATTFRFVDILPPDRGVTQAAWATFFGHAAYTSMELREHRISLYNATLAFVMKSTGAPLNERPSRLRSLKPERCLKTIERAFNIVFGPRKQAAEIAIFRLWGMSLESAVNQLSDWTVMQGPDGRQG